MSGKSYTICEFGTIRKSSDYEGLDGFNHVDNMVYLPDKSFDSIYNFILENQGKDEYNEPPFSLFQKDRHIQIKAKNYVGVIETKDGVSLEILPKIHLTESNEAVFLRKTRSVFLKMLGHLKDSPLKDLSVAHLSTKSNFPILEVFISSFIKEIELLLNKNIRNDYVNEKDNINFVRGKLLVRQNIKYNFINKAKFYCEFSEFTINTPQNRIIKTTLIKLLKKTRNHLNLTRLNKLISIFDSVDISKDITKDLKTCKVSIGNNRLYLAYRNILMWSEIFLTGKSFTNFRGSAINTAVLFPMERIFEDYIVGIFKTYCEGYKIKTQDRSYSLIERHIDEKRVQLRPDMVLENEAQRKIIIDAKWKLIDGTKFKGNYKISLPDLYQLYAYGKKYAYNEPDKKNPTLVLLYPSNEQFSKNLPNFVYEVDPVTEDGLSLEVIPFDLAEDILSNNEQINRIIQYLAGRQPSDEKTPKIYDINSLDDIAIAADGAGKYNSK